MVASEGLSPAFLAAVLASLSSSRSLCMVSGESGLKSPSRRAFLQSLPLSTCSPLVILARMFSTHRAL
eukprot:12621976-Alexandrium_andersonii.AAC.1